MLTVVDPTGRRAGWQAVLAALALIPVSLRARAGRIPASAACCISLLAAPARAWANSRWPSRFGSQPNDFRARLLLRASLVYLPTLLAMLMLGCRGS